MPVQKIRTYLWFNNTAEEAVNLYVSIFGDSKMVSVMRKPDGSAMICDFQLEGQQFLALNGGPMFKFTEATSLFVTCESQEEVDRYWDKLIADGGEPSMCGWLKDKFGLSWQIIPSALMELMQSNDAARANRVMQAMLKMKKIDVADLRRAADNG